MTQLQKLRLSLAVISLPLGAISVAAQNVVVNWGGDYVSSDQSFQSGGFTSGDPQPLSPTTGYAGPSANFLGMVTATSDTSGFVVNQNAAGDRLQFRVVANETGSGLVLWDDFGGGAIGFNETSSIGVTFATLSGSGITRRLVLRDVAGNYYASTSTSTLFSGTNPVTVNPADTSWFVYDPETDIFAVGTSAGLDFAEAQFSEVGFVVNFSGASANPRAVRVDGFQVTAVPEPTTTGLIFGALTGGFIFVMRRRTRKS